MIDFLSKSVPLNFESVLKYTKQPSNGQKECNISDQLLL